MTIDDATAAQLREQAKAVWGLGEYGELVAGRLAPAAEALVEAAGVRAGQHVLDVAAGTGNVAAVAAARGAHVTATDLSPRMVELGRARTAGLDVEWSEADAEALPFADASVDHALSAFGLMFAPRQRRAAAELLRVVRPGGSAGMTAWIPEGPQAAAMQVMSDQFPDRPQTMHVWGDPEIARAHFETAGASDVVTERRSLRWSFAEPQEWLDFVERGPGPMVAAQRALGEERWADVRARMLAAVTAGDGPFEIESPFLLILARRA